MLPLDPEGTCTGPLRSPYLYISSAKANTHDTFSLLEDDSSQPTAATSLTSIINSRRRSPSTSSRGEMSISYLLLTAANQPASLASSSSCSAFHSPPPPPLSLSPLSLKPVLVSSSQPSPPLPLCRPRYHRIPFSTSSHILFQRRRRQQDARRLGANPQPTLTTYLQQANKLRKQVFNSLKKNTASY